MSKRNKIPATEVLEWLSKNHPEIREVAEIDRDWVWIAVNLSGEEHRATRDSLKEFGFAYKTKGAHPLQSGRMGTWSHSCTRPISFKKRGGARRAAPENEESEAELLRFAAMFAAA